jgi:peptide/nickel transport system permease protein
MWRYLGIRIAQSVFTLFLFLTLIFFLLEAQPGDFGSVLFGDLRLTPAQLQAVREQLGIDRTPLEQYLHWMDNFLRGDLGTSLSEYPRSVAGILAERAPRTAVLFLTATVLSFYLGFGAGKILAWRRGSGAEYIATIGGVTLYTVFTPWFALWMLWFFAFYLRIFPVGRFITYEIWEAGAPPANSVFLQILIAGLVLPLLLAGFFRLSERLSPEGRRRSRIAGTAALAAATAAFWIVSGQGVYVLDILYHLALPVLTLTLISFGGTMLLTRNSMLSVLREDYIAAARARGLPEQVVRDRHAARNALLPVVTTFVFSLAFAVDGGAVTESIFSWEGMGYTLVNAVTQSDIPLAVGALVATGGLVLLAHLAADILYAYLDPRIRYS